MNTEFLRDFMNRAAEQNHCDWDAYFETIVPVCPWALANWKQQRIEITEWQDRAMVQDLTGPLIARIYTLSEATVQDLQVLVGQCNQERSNEEWLYSHPLDGNNSTPVPVLIQQDYAELNKARQHNHLDQYRKQPR